MQGMDGIAKGDFLNKITNNFYCYFNNIKNNLNIFIESMNEITRAVKNDNLFNPNCHRSKRNCLKGYKSKSRIE
jgi:hypothetical protein